MMQHQLPQDTFYVDHQGRFIVAFEGKRIVYIPTAAQYRRLAIVFETVAQQLDASDDNADGNIIEPLAFTEVALSA